MNPAVDDRPMWTQVRATVRKQRNENSQGRIRTNSNYTPEALVTPPPEDIKRATARTKIISVAQDSPLLSLRKSSENMPMLYRKGNMHFGSEPIKQRKKPHRRVIAREKEFGTLVR